MGYLASICRNFTSFLTLQNISSGSRGSFPDEMAELHVNKRPHKQKAPMLPSPASCKSKGFLESPGGFISKNGTFMLLTPETPSVERKRRILGESSLSGDSDLDLDGSTLISNNFSKRARLSTRSDRSSSCEGSYVFLNYDNDLEESTLIEDEPLSGISKCDDDIGDISTSDSGTSSGSEDEESSFSDVDNLLTPDDEVEVREKESENGTIKVLLPTQQRRRNGSRYIYYTEEPYRPSPNIVDKNLSSEIVRRDAHESDLSEDEIYDGKHSAKKSDKRDLDSEFCMEKAKRWAAAVEGPSGAWADAERDMYFRLAMRGFEPILPRSWKRDFMTLPDSLFSPAGDRTAYLSSRNEFRGMRYFSNLVALGGRVRDRIACDLRPERVIRQYLCSYIQWSLRDADMHNRPHFIPPYSVYTLKRSQATKDAVNIMNRRLVAVAKSYRSSWRLTPSIECHDAADDYFDTEQQYPDRTFPIITGFLIRGSIVALITLDSDPKVHPIFDMKTSGRLISRFDFSEYGQDVWNALAVAIAVARMQKTIAQCKEEGEGEIMWMADRRIHTSDEDL
ncbi:hypothetical protein FQN49_004662 [Arthroderma sp. PD_2]|nr:hypothetical protein FQN49_004662 [Arthroderma sp. PD_2]